MSTAPKTVELSLHPRSMSSVSVTTDKYSGDIKGKSRVFNESTHKYFIYFGIDHSINGLVLSLLTLGIQLGSYVIVLLEGIALTEYVGRSNNQYGVTIGRCPGNGERFTILDTDTFLASNFYCDKFDRSGNSSDDNIWEILGGMMLSFILLILYVAYDILACIKVFLSTPSLWSKFAILVIMAESALGFYCGVVFAYAAVFNGSPYEALVNCVGVLFIHDLDEKIYEAGSAVSKEEMTNCNKCCCGKCLIKYLKCCCILCCLLVGMVGGYCIVVLYLFPTYIQNN